MWFVYLARCSDDSLYCGITNNLEKRFKAHNSGKGSKYTRSRLPVRLVWKTEVGSKSEALKKEYRVKKLSKPLKELLVAEGKINT